MGAALKVKSLCNFVSISSQFDLKSIFHVSLAHILCVKFLHLLFGERLNLATFLNLDELNLSNVMEQDSHLVWFSIVFKGKIINLEPSSCSCILEVESVIS